MPPDRASGSRVNLRKDRRLAVDAPIVGSERRRRRGRLGHEPGRRGHRPEPIVEPDLDELQVRADVGRALEGETDVVDPRSEIDIVVLDLAGPISGQGKFNADAGNPSDVKQGLGRERVAVFIIDDHFGLAEGHAARDVRKDRAEGNAGARPCGREVIVGRMEGCECQRRPIERGDEAQVAFQSQHEAVGPLDVEAGLVAPNDARFAVAKNLALRRQWRDARPKAAAAVAKVEADVGAGPVVRVRTVERPDRRRSHIGGQSRMAKHAQQ